MTVRVWGACARDCPPAGHRDGEYCRATKEPTEAVSEVSETGTPLTSHSDTSDTSDSHLADRLLAGVHDGAWLDSQNFPELRYTVPGVIPEGLSLLVAPPKVGKSWMMLGIQLAVASGGYALGTIPVGAARRVLYLALEDGDRRMQSRARTLLGTGERGIAVPIPKLFTYMTRIEPGHVTTTIEAYLHLHSDTSLVVIDTLGRVMPAAQPNETTYQRDYRVGARLKTVADSLPGLSMVVVHHTRKLHSGDFVEMVSATNGLAGAADTILMLQRARQSRDGTLSVTGRDVAEAEYALKVDDGQWMLDGKDLTEAAERAQEREESGNLGETAAAIVAFVRQQDGPARAGVIAAKFGKDAYQYLGRLVESGRLVKLKRGLYGVSEVSEVSETKCEVCSQSLDPLYAEDGIHPGCEPG